MRACGERAVSVHPEADADGRWRAEDRLLMVSMTCFDRRHLFISGRSRTMIADCSPPLAEGVRFRC
jgi:hypothetical protein